MDIAECGCPTDGEWIYHQQMVCSNLKSSRREHPKIEVEVERHRDWGHTLQNVTPHESEWNEYLCSCGILLGRNLL